MNRMVAKPPCYISWPCALALLPVVFGMSRCGASFAQQTHGGAPVPKGSLVHAGDYSFGFYPYGWRRPQENAPIHFAVQTNHYALLLNASRARVERLGPIAAPPDGARAAAQGNEVLTSLPAAELSFSAVWNGHAFPVGLGAGSPEQVRLYRVGKYLQHFDIQTVQLGGNVSGPGLEGVNAWMEAYCWTDRLTMQLHVSTYRNHLTPPHKLDGVVLTASLKVPAEYPLVEVLGADGAWRPAKPGDRSELALSIRNPAGAGVALIGVPGAGQHLRLSKDGFIRLETDPLSLPVEGLKTFPCLVVPSTDVRRAALREVRQMRTALDSRIRVSAVGLAPYTQGLDTQYDPVRGWHQIRLGENADPTKMERVRVTLDNPDREPHTLRLNFAKIGGAFSITGMSPVLRDADGYPIGLPVQISKNWHCAPPWFSGLTMIDLEPGQHLEMEFDLAYAFWGGVPAVSHAQLCLFGYASNQLWDEMAIGSFGESICYDPDVNLNRSIVDDMRPLMVWAMGPTAKTKWSWTHNLGGCDFLTLFRKGTPRRQYLVRQKTLYAGYGPVLSDVTYAGQTPDGTIQSQVRTQSWRSDDYVRALYTIRYDVVKTAVDIDRLAFFQLGADHYNGLQYRKAARGSAQGLLEVWDPVMGGRKYSRRSEKLDGDMPWIGLYDVQKRPETGFDKADQGALANKAMIVRRWKARLNGVECPLPHYSVYGSTDGIASALVELSPPGGVQSLKPGDFVDTQVEVLVLPQRAEDYYGPNRNLIAALQGRPESWALTHREAASSNVELKARAGTVEQTWPVRIRAEGGRQAEFTITGGVGYTPVTITGAADRRPFTLQRLHDDGTAKTIDESSAVGRDWWQARFDPATSLWELTFTLCLDTPGDKRAPQTFRWTLAPASSSAAAIGELWHGVDPRREPLETDPVRKWTEDGLQLEQLYFTGETWQGQKTRIYAIQGAPVGGQRLPGILHIHGGGQTASLDWVRFWAKRGYVCASFDFCGDWRKQAPDRQEFTKWGKVPGDMATNNGMSVQGDPRENSWFHWALTARRALTLLEQHPQVDRDRLGIFGISVGGSLTWLVAGTDGRVKAAAPIYGCGWNTYVRPDQVAADPVDQATRAWRELLSSESYAPLVKCPVLFLNATNDFHGNMDRSFATLAMVPTAEKRHVYTPRYNHHIEPSEGADLSLWMDRHLKGVGGPWPQTPRVALQGGQERPEIHMVPDQSTFVRQVQIYYALSNVWPQSRFWRSTSTRRREDGVFVADAPFIAADDVIHAFANVTYASGVRLSSSLIKVVARDLPGVKPTLTWEPVIDDMSDGEDWRYGPAYTDPTSDASYFVTWQGPTGEKGFTLNPALWGGGEIAFDIGTHKIGDPQWRGQGRETLLLDYDAGRPLKGLTIKAIQRDWQPTRQEYVFIPGLPRDKGDSDRPDWFTIRISPDELKGPKGNSLPNWREVNCLTLIGTAKANRPPVFRNLRWGT